MFDKVFLIIALVPLKLGTAQEDFVGISHCPCILPSYTSGKSVYILIPMMPVPFSQSACKSIVARRSISKDLWKKPLTA
jgi:hypothetical protein